MIKRQYFIRCESRGEDNEVISFHWILFYRRSWFPKDSDAILAGIKNNICDSMKIKPAHIDVVAFNRI